MHHRSALPTSAKQAFIANEEFRISSRCSSSGLKQQRLAEFHHVLRSSGYPTSFFNQRRPRRDRRPRTSTSTSQAPSPLSPPNRRWFYLSLPFISDSVDRHIRNVFRRNDLPVRLTHRSHTLRQALSSRQRPQTTCNLRNCQMNTSGICLHTNVIYEIKCLACNGTYIGSTIRLLHIRVREHMLPGPSSVYRHIIQCQGSRQDIAIHVIGRDCNPINLRLKEALLIKRQKPTINSREECTQYKDYIF